MKVPEEKVLSIRLLVRVRRLSLEELTELMSQIKVDYLWWRP
jgi:hypothetical protein